LISQKKHTKQKETRKRVTLVQLSKVAQSSMITLTCHVFVPANLYSQLK